MDIPISAIRLRLEVLVQDLDTKKWGRLGDKTDIPGAAVGHREDISARLCRELNSLWRRSKGRWFGRAAFSLANVRLEIDTARIAMNGSWVTQTLFVERDYHLDGTVALEDFGEHVVQCFTLMLPKFWEEAGRKVYGTSSTLT